MDMMASAHLTRGRGGGGPGSTRIFVGNIPMHISANEVAECFEPFGAIRDANIPKDYHTGKEKPFCFITFSTAMAISLHHGSLHRQLIDRGYRASCGRAVVESPHLHWVRSTTPRRHWKGQRPLKWTCDEPECPARRLNGARSRQRGPHGRNARKTFSRDGRRT